MATHPDSLHTANFSFIDNHGRTIHLRGVNLSGSSKAPLNQPSHLLSHFWDEAEKGGESFIGQPLNLDDGSADQHLARLRGWGFNLLRFPVTWESLEHAGPKKYDHEYMDYLICVLHKCKQYGFRVYMDPHQDTWSRFSGGSGAPFWTLPACGVNPYNLSSTHAALIHSEWPLPHSPDPASFPAMIWGTNYGRLLSQTLFTLFFAGKAFAPNCIIDNMNIQDYLQSHYISAFGEFADRIRKADEETWDEDSRLFDSCIIGWDSLNEPAEGLVEWDDLNTNPTKQGTTLKKGTSPTPAQSLRLGMGQSQTVETWDFGTFGPKRTGTATINPKGRKIWAEPDSTEGTNGAGERPDGTHPRWGWKRDVSKWPLGKCIWALHGVWDIESGFVLRPDYFKFHPSTGIEVHFLTDFWVPHFKSYTSRIRSAHPNSIAFIQPPVFALPPRVGEETLKGRCAYTGHYYDGLTLITKHWNWFNADSLGVLRGKYKSPFYAVKFGEKAIRKSIMEQIGMLKGDAELITAPPPPSLLPPPPLASASSAVPPLPIIASTSTSSSTTSLPLPPTFLNKPNQYPTVIGEIGTPFDMDNKSSYYSPSHKGDYTNQEKALDASLNGCDGDNNVSYTLWTYVGSGGNGHEWGDAWNGEDLSLWCADDLRGRCRGGNGGKAKIEEGGGKKSEVKVKSESQARLLAPPSGNASALSLNTISSTRGRGEGSSGPVTPSESTPTLLLPLSHKSSVTFSSKTVVEDDDGNDNGDPTVRQLSRRAETTVTTDTMIDSGWENTSYTSDDEPDKDPYDFLTNGARAVRAFCRPRPLRVWGRVVDTRFEIGKAEFKCVIRVPPRTSKATTANEGEAREEADEEQATEIYLPLVHFAHTSILEGSKARWDPDSDDDGEGRGKILLSSSKAYATTQERGAERQKRRVLEGIEQRDDLLDVEVTVSVGEWKIRGQKLFWWYPHPRSGGESGDEEGEEEVMIEVKRRGGAIKLGKGGWIEPKSWQTDHPREERKRWCGCDMQCVVM